MTKNLYLTSAEIDEIICTETKTEVALPSLSEWVSSFVCFIFFYDCYYLLRPRNKFQTPFSFSFSNPFSSVLTLIFYILLLTPLFAFLQALGLVRKIRGKYSAFCREYFESALEVPHVSKVTPFEAITGIVKQRAEKDQGFSFLLSFFLFLLWASTHCVLRFRTGRTQKGGIGEKSHCICFEEDIQSAWQHILDGTRRDHCLSPCFFLFFSSVFVFPHSDLFSLSLFLVHLLPSGAPCHR